MKKIYLDNAATTRVDSKVVDVMKFEFGNPSSVHSFGEEARKAVDGARGIIAKKINSRPSEIVFTSGGTEANNLVLKGLFFSEKFHKRKNHIVTTRVEHDSILETCEWLKRGGARVTYLDVDKDGFVDLKALEKEITPKTFLVSIIHGNNEIGTIQRLKEIGKICKRKKVLFHTDACQSFGKTRINVTGMNLDFASLNSHKIHGPKGVGALYVREQVKAKITPLLHGGGQEGDLRSGTENVSGIVGFGKSVELASGKDVERMTRLRDEMIKGLLEIRDVTLNGPFEERLCNNINVSFKGVDGEVLNSYLDARGILVSPGAACSSRKEEESHVLKAIGLSKSLAKSSIRISLSKFTTSSEVSAAVKEIKKVVERLRS